MSILRKDYYHLKVPGDGDCFFHSISEALHLEKYKKKIGDKYYTFRLKDKGDLVWLQNSENLRKLCVSWMKDNLQTFVNEAEKIKTAIEDAISNDKDRYPDISTYLTKMKQQGEYGGQPEIYALSYILQRNIITYVDSGKDAYKSYGGGLSSLYNKSSPTIYLYHNIKKVKSSGGHHFDVLYPKKEDKIIKMDIYDRSSGNPSFISHKKKKVSETKYKSKKLTPHQPIHRKKTGQRIIRTTRQKRSRTRAPTRRQSRASVRRSRTRAPTRRQSRAPTRRQSKRSNKVLKRVRK